MDKKTKEILSSFLAILLCAAFLWVGKTYIWDKALPGIPKPDDTLDSQIVPDVTVPDGTGSTASQTTDLTAGTDITGSTLSAAEQTTLNSDQQSSAVNRVHSDLVADNCDRIAVQARTGLRDRAGGLLPGRAVHRRLADGRHRKLCAV